MTLATALLLKHATEPSMEQHRQITVEAEQVVVADGKGLEPARGRKRRTQYPAQGKPYSVAEGLINDAILRQGWVLGSIEGMPRQFLQVHWMRRTVGELQELAAQLGLDGFAPRDPKAQRALPIHWLTLLWTDPADPNDRAERDRILAITALIPSADRKVFGADAQPVLLHEILVRKTDPADASLIDRLHDASALPFDAFRRPAAWQPTVYSVGF